jgi:2'-5' RNA ligase
VPGKTHHTAVAVVPPEGVWEPIQAIRRRHDRQIRRWRPHVNLLYPFRPRPDFAAAAELLANACAAIEPFRVALAEFRFFRHGSGRCTLWLAPEPAEKLRRLQPVLQAAFPTATTSAASRRALRRTSASDSSPPRLCASGRGSSCRRVGRRAPSFLPR